MMVSSGNTSVVRDMPMDQLMQALQQLTVDDTPFSIVNVLTSANHKFYNTPKGDILNVINQPILTTIFLLAGSSNSEVRESAISLLRILLGAVPVTAMFDQCHAHILAALNNAPAPTRIAILNKMTARVETEEGAEFVACLKLTSFALIIATARLFRIKELGVGTAANKFITAIASVKPSGPEVVFGCSALSEELQTLSKDQSSEIRFRVYELVVCQLSAASEELFKKCVQSGLVAGLVNELKSDDILVQLNALELLSEMSIKSYMTDYFKGTNLLSQLHDMLLRCQDSPDGSFIYPALIRFFGCLCRVYPTECITAYPQFMKSALFLVNQFDSLDPIQRLLGFDTFANIAATATGKKVLDEKHGPAMQMVMRRFGDSLRSGPLEIRIRHIESLKQMLEVKAEDQSQNPELVGITESWYNMVDSKDTSGYLISLYKNPIEEFNLAIGQLLVTVAQQSWGTTKLVKQIGFVEYVLDRKTASCLNGRYVKYDLVKAFLAHGVDVLSTDNVLKLKEYERQGPNYVAVDMQVIVEDVA